MDAIEYTPQLRDALELLTNTTLVQDNLMTEEQIKKTKTIFSKDTNREQKYKGVETYVYETHNTIRKHTDQMQSCK